MPQSLPPLTPEAFVRYLKCPLWPYWDLFADPKDREDVPDALRRLRDEGLLHEERVLARYAPVTRIPSEGSVDARAAATLEAMKKGETVHRGVLVEGDWVATPDLLVPTEGASKLGPRIYEPVDIKASRHLDDAHRLQLTFTALLLKSVQGVKPECGRIVNADAEETLVDIEESEGLFFDVLDRLLAIRKGEKPDAVLSSGCKSSPWFGLCRREAEETDSVGLIYKIYKNEAKRLREAGYGTLASLAAADPRVLAGDVHGVPDARVARLQLQAQSLREKRTVRIDEPRLPDAPVELYYDIEGDPTQGVEYLHGVLVRTGSTATYHSFLAERPDGEEAAWQAFCDFMERHEGAPIYHYGWYELDTIKRLSATYGWSRGAGRALDAANMIDLNRVAQRCVIFPLYFYSLKDIAKHLGFRWRAADASGANSVLWFQDWLTTGDRALLEKIVAYNEDDVRATLFLKEWLVSGKV